MKDYFYALLADEAEKIVGVVTWQEAWVARQAVMQKIKQTLPPQWQRRCGGRRNNALSFEWRRYKTAMMGSRC